MLTENRNITIKTLDGIDMDTLLDAFEEAFGGYDVKFDRREVATMFKRRGFCRELSFAAFDGDKIAAFTYNGTGYFNGKTTCYDCATGTLPGHRGKGLAGEIFRQALPTLSEAGAEQYLLEVLKNNESAIALYTKNGFEVSAEYDCFNGLKQELRLEKDCSLPVCISRTNTVHLSAQKSFCDFEPSWQNSYESLMRGEEGLVCLKATLYGKCIGYCVADPLSGDISQIAVEPSHRRAGVATALLREIMTYIESAKIKCLNIDEGCTSLKRFLESINLQAGLSQYAMIRPIQSLFKI